MGHSASQLVLALVLGVLVTAAPAAVGATGTSPAAPPARNAGPPAVGHLLIRVIALVLPCLAIVLGLLLRRRSRSHNDEQFRRRGLRRRGVDNSPAHDYGTAPRLRGREQPEAPPDERNGEPSRRSG